MYSMTEDLPSKETEVVSCLLENLWGLAREISYPAQVIASEDDLGMMKQESIPLLFPEEVHYSTNRV